MVPEVRPINDVTVPESGITYTKLLTSSNRAVVVNGDETSVPGTQTIAMAALKRDINDSSKDVRIVMLGSNYLMLDTQLLYSTENIYFTVNAFDWLVNSDNTVTVPQQKAWTYTGYGPVAVVGTGTKTGNVLDCKLHHILLSQNYDLGAYSEILTLPEK